MTDAPRSPRSLRLFLSSPGDVADERQAVRRVLEDLALTPLLRTRVRFDLVAWDDPAAPVPLDATETPQLSVNRYKGPPRDCDLTVVILWSRLGTPLPSHVTRPDGSAYPSGTVWELEDARAGGKPLWLYQRTAFGEPNPEFVSHGHAHSVGAAGNDEHHSDIHDVNTYEWIAWTPLLIAIVVFGVYPQLMFKVMDPAVTQLVEVFQK